MQFRSISNRTVEALKVDKDTVFWDRELSGFGVRVYPSGGKVYIVQVRGPSGAKRVTVGRHGVLNAGQARKRGALIIARLKAGETLTPELSASMRSGGQPSPNSRSDTSKTMWRSGTDRPRTRW